MLNIFTSVYQITKKCYLSILASIHVPPIGKSHILIEFNQAKFSQEIYVQNICSRPLEDFGVACVSDPVLCLVNNFVISCIFSICEMMTRNYISRLDYLSATFKED